MKQGLIDKSCFVDGGGGWVGGGSVLESKRRRGTEKTKSLHHLNLVISLVYLLPVRFDTTRMTSYKGPMAA